MTKNIIKALRPQFWILSIIPGVAGVCLSCGIMALQEVLLIIIILGPGISATAELVNDYVDQKYDASQVVKKLGGVPFSGGSGVVFQGGLKKKEVLPLTILFSSLSILCASLLNNYVLILVLVGLFIAIGYSLQPVRLKSRGIFGVLAMAIGRGILSFHIGWLSFSLPNVTSIVIGVFLSLLFFGSATLPYLADYKEDKKSKIYTFPVQVGFENASRIAAYSIILAFIFLLTAKTYFPITLNFFILPLIVISFVFLREIMKLKYDNSNITKLQIIGMIIVCLSPFIFF
jgi:4-hydroxybenzoate polyprenyltransferase